MEQRDSLLAALVGEDLASVVFVTDYLQLVFNGPVLTLLTWPVVTWAGEGARSYGDPGYRDALCALIGKAVSGSEESDAAGLTLAFPGVQLWVRPTLDELTGPEIAMLQLGKEGGEWMVWRPGEPPFDHL